MDSTYRKNKNISDYVIKKTKHYRTNQWRKTYRGVTCGLNHYVVKAKIKIPSRPNGKEKKQNKKPIKLKLQPNSNTTWTAGMKKVLQCHSNKE